VPEQDDEATKDEKSQADDVDRTKASARDPERDDADGPWAKTSGGNPDDITDS